MTMGSTSVSSSAALVAGSLLVAAAASVVGLYSWRGGSKTRSAAARATTSSDGGEITDIDEEEDDNVASKGSGEFITSHEVVQIFDKLHVEMQSVFAQLMQQVQQIKMSGAPVNERQLKGLVAAELERTLLIKQKLVLDEFDIDYDCLEEATWEFLQLEDENKAELLHSPLVKKSVERFQKFWQTTTGQPVAGWRPGMTAEQVAALAHGGGGSGEAEILSAERTVEAAQVYFGTMTQSMRTLVAQYKAAGKNLQSPIVAQQLNADFANTANEAGEEALLDTCGISQSQFEASIKAHAENPSVARALAMMQMQQQQELMAMQSSM
jgi:hypothetical protein